MAFDVYGRGDGAPGQIIVPAKADMPASLNPEERRLLFTVDDVPSSVRREIDAKGWAERPLWRAVDARAFAAATAMDG